MSNALAIHCRNPGEFIASVVERHRDFPLPRSEDEKTYLLFIGLEGEDELLEQIPEPSVKCVEISNRDSECGLHGDQETVRYPVQEEAGSQAAETPSRRLGVRGFPRRIKIHRVPLDEGMDNVYDEGGFCNYNLCGDAGSEAGSETCEAVIGPSPIPQIQQGSSGGVRIAGGLGFRNTRYHTTDGEGGEVGEVTGEELIEWHSRLPPNLLRDLDEIGDEEDERIVNGKNESGLDKPIVSQELTPQFLQLCDRSGKILAAIEEIHHSVINYQRNPGETSQKQPDSFIVGEGTIIPAASEEFPQSVEAPMLTFQVKTASPIPDQISSPNWTSGFGFKNTGDPGEVGKDDDGTNDEQKESNKSSSDSGMGVQGTVLADPSEIRGVEEHERSQTSNKTSSEALPHRHQSIFLVREPGSPIRPQRDEISLFTKLSDSSQNPNTNEEKSMKLEVEGETPPYPAKTLENLISIEHVNIVYLEDLETLHGFLEAMMFSPAAPGPNTPLLAIWGLVRAHYQTKYFGGEGIGETVARAVETAAKSGRFLVLGEGCIEADYGDGEDEVQETWWVDLEVPILNMGRMIVGSTVVVGQILRRWCRFGEDLDELEEAGEDGEHGNDDEDDRDDNVVMRVP